MIGEAKALINTSHRYTDEPDVQAAMIAEAQAYAAIAQAEALERIASSITLKSNPLRLHGRHCPHCGGDIKTILHHPFECASCGHTLSAVLEFIDLTAAIDDDGKGPDWETVAQDAGGLAE